MAKHEVAQLDFALETRGFEEGLLLIDFLGQIENLAEPVGCDEGLLQARLKGDEALQWPDEMPKRA